MAIRLVFNPKVGWKGEAKSEPITYREMHILNLAAHGYSNKEIAETLGIAYQTVKNNFHKLMKKLGAKNNAHALILAMQSRLITVELVSDDMDELLPLEEREAAKLNIMQEIDKISEMGKEEADVYMAEQHWKALHEVDEE